MLKEKYDLSYQPLIEDFSKVLIANKKFKDYERKWILDKICILCESRIKQNRFQNVNSEFTRLLESVFFVMGYRKNNKIWIYHLKKEGYLQPNILEKVMGRYKK
jgi:hypothetical protein